MHPTGDGEMTEPIEQWEIEFKKFTDGFDLYGNEWQDMGCDKVFKAGFEAAKRAQKPVELLPMCDAPKDKPIILDVGYPWPVVAQWNEHDEAWCYANLNASTMENGKVDVWFENEHEKNPRGWMPMPEVNHVNKR